MSRYDIEDSGAEKAPLHARLVAEADVVTIAPPPTLAVRAAGTRRIRRRRALQAVSGAAAACAVAGAVVAWSPQHTTATPVGPGPGASSPHDADTPPSASRPSQTWPTDYAPDLPGYVRTKDLGAGWIGPYTIPEGNVSPTLSRLLDCKGSEGQFIATHLVHSPAFRIFQDPGESTALVEAVYSFTAGQATYAMGVLRGAPNSECENLDVIVPGTRPAGDDSMVLALGSNPQSTTWVILIRRGDKIAYVSTSAVSAKTDPTVWRDAIEAAVVKRLSGS